MQYQDKRPDKCKVVGCNYDLTGATDNPCGDATCAPVTGPDGITQGYYDKKGKFKSIAKVQEEIRQAAAKKPKSPDKNVKTDKKKGKDKAPVTVEKKPGLEDLENILENMTKLCKEPKCGAIEFDMLKLEEKVTIPCPERPCCEPPSTPPCCPELSGRQKLKKELDELRSLCADVKGVCRSPTCYGAYMGYKVSEPKYVCGQNPCLNATGERICCCGGPFCPYSTIMSPSKLEQLSDASSEKIHQTRTTPIGSNPPYPQRHNYFCPSTNPEPNQKSPSNKFTENLNCNSVDCIFTLPNYPNICESTDCAFTISAQKQKTTESLKFQKTCGSPECPYSIPPQKQKTFESLNFQKTYGNPPQKQNRSENFNFQETCGNPDCPYSIPLKKQPSISGNLDRSQMQTCGNLECPFSLKNLELNCGSPDCPASSSTQPNNINPDLADSKYHGNQYIHDYPNDKIFVQEAARPYCGSASPYDYLSSFDKNYATNLAANYELFDYTEPPAVPPCPYLIRMKKQTQRSCGKANCIYTNQNYYQPSKFQQKEDNFCINDTCPFTEGICGGPKIFSCDNPSVQPCGSPDCKVPQTERGKDNIENIFIGQCEDAGLYSCNNPDVNPCGSPICKFNAGDGICGGPKQFSCENPDVIHCQSPDCKVPSAGDGQQEESISSEHSKCSLKTCPYYKKFIICTDCGGVLVEDFNDGRFECPKLRNPTPPEIIDKEDSYETYVEPEDPPIDAPEDDMDTISKRKKLKENAEQSPETSVPKKKKILPENIELYDYPGVQIGHRDCTPYSDKIPKNMGWLWNARPTYGNAKTWKLWRGYKPGCIDRTVFKIIQGHRRALGLLDAGPKKKRSRTKFKYDDLKHLIEIKKQNGDYNIIVNPVKDPQTTERFENPFLDVTPIQFKIEKEEKPPKPGMETCPCDVEDTHSSSTSSHKSVFEFNFSPPAALPHNKKKKKSHMVTTTTQYLLSDINEVASSKKTKKRKKKKKGKKK